MFVLIEFAVHCILEKQAHGVSSYKLLIKAQYDNVEESVHGIQQESNN